MNKLREDLQLPVALIVIFLAITTHRWVIPCLTNVIYVPLMLILLEPRVGGSMSMGVGGMVEICHLAPLKS
jgi:hypothetical protein